MSTHSLLDPELLPLADPNAGFVLSADTLTTSRVTMGQMMAQIWPPVVNAPRVVSIPTSDGAGEIALRIFAPAGDAQGRPALLEIHGGGFVLGDASMNDGVNDQRSREFGAVVVSIDYRLAPETAFPGPVEDFYAGLTWVMPPAFIGVGAMDLFVDEDIDYAARLIRARVPVEFHIYPGAPHGFDILGDATVSRQLSSDLATAISRAFS